MMQPPSEKSRGVALALCIPLGVFGAHRFYVGKIGTGLLQLCTLGGMGLWYLYDLILIAAGEFRDEEGRKVSQWDPNESSISAAGVPQELMDEVDSLRREVAELSDRVDFAERLLANPGRREPSTSA